MKFNLLVDGQNYDIELRKGKSAMVWVGNQTFAADVKKTDDGLAVVLDDKEFAVKVNRPEYSVLENRFLKDQNLNIMRHWREGLETYLTGS